MTANPPKIFNTTGPCEPEKHYMLPVLPRLPDVQDMITNDNYFILHAPRQSGKTTFLKALTDKINSDGQKYAIKCSLANLKKITDEEKAMTKIVSQLNMAMKASNVSVIKEKFRTYNTLLGTDDADIKVRILLNQLCLDLDKPLVVFFDEADLLAGSGLLTFLAQIRDGFNDRDNLGNKFPSSLALIGMRNIRDYLASDHPEASGQHLASPFIIVAEKMTLANFTQDEIGQLYGQHTEATGQIFQNDAIERAWHWTEGQPWLVNALARQTVQINLKNNYSVTITGKHIDLSAEDIIKRRDSHIDSLLERLREVRVRRVMEAVITGKTRLSKYVTEDDEQYVQDLGLLKKTEESFLPANPIYQEVIIRTLSKRYEREFNEEVTLANKNRWIQGPKLNISALLKSFQDYWRRNSEALEDPNGYSEALALLVANAFFQRLLNGGVQLLQREYALGKDRLDLCAFFKGQYYPVELKIKSSKSLPQSITQLK
jgi:hypothetical protein